MRSGWEYAESRAGQRGGATTADDKYKKLPDPIDLEDTITSAETQPVPEEKDDYWREVEWMLRITGGG